MTTPNIGINPAITTVMQGAFADATAAGGVQGTAMPDPSTIWSLRTGTLSSAETLPMWGGVAVYQNVPTGLLTGPSGALGPLIGRAGAVSGGSTPISGFSTFDQAYASVSTAQSTVPTVGTNGQVMVYPLGCRQRLWLACDPGLITLRAGTILSSGSVAWDFVNQQLVPFTGSINVSSGTYDGALTISSGTYNATSGLVTLTLSSASHLSPGNTFTITSATGTGSFASINGAFTAGAGTSGATVTFTISAYLTMTITGGTLNSGLVVLTLASAANLNPGDSVVVAGLTGSGSFAQANGTFTTVAGTTGSTVAYQIAGGLTVTISTTGTISTGTALSSLPTPFTILDVSVGNSQTVNYSSLTGFATWNFAGSCALCQI